MVNTRYAAARSVDRRRCGGAIRCKKSTHSFAVSFRLSRTTLRVHEIRPLKNRPAAVPPMLFTVLCNVRLCARRLNEFLADSRHTRRKRPRGRRVDAVKIRTYIYIHTYTHMYCVTYALFINTYRSNGRNTFTAKTRHVIHVIKNFFLERGGGNWPTCVR